MREGMCTDLACRVCSLAGTTQFDGEVGYKHVNRDRISKWNGWDLQSIFPCVCISFPSFYHTTLLVSQDWLTKFGYLPPPDPVTGQLQTQEELTKAITAMQRFGGLEATGVLGQWLMTPPFSSAEGCRDGSL